MYFSLFTLCYVLKREGSEGECDRDRGRGNEFSAMNHKKNDDVRNKCVRLRHVKTFTASEK